MKFPQYSYLKYQGPPGTGKTSSVMCLAREMLKDTIKEAVLELNASDERGIEVVREKIKSFAHQKVVVPDNMHKIIILDEADSMTDSAQQALRMVMTEYTDTTRFALACNDSSKIIEAIQSRWAIIRFTKLQDDEVSERLIYVMEQEGIEYDAEGLAALIFRIIFYSVSTNLINYIYLLTVNKHLTNTYNYRLYFKVL